MEKENKALAYENFIKQSNENIKIEAIVERALSDKITSEIINQKVNAEVNSIQYGIKKINSRFTEKSKNYDIVKEQILDTMTKYEKALKQMGEFYDGKIEQLIIRRFELQINLVGSIAKEQYLMSRKEYKSKERNNDKIKNVFTLGIKKAIEKLREKKKKSSIDVAEINALKDKQEIEEEQIININNSINTIEEELKINKENREKMNKEIYLLSAEIKRLNERKKTMLMNAMEVEEKWMVTKIKKPKTFEKITRFFSSIINTPKVVKKTVIEPLNLRIDSFVENELSNIK